LAIRATREDQIGVPAPARRARLDSQFLRAHIVTIEINNGDGPAFGGVPIRRVQSPGILHVVV